MTAAPWKRQRDHDLRVIPTGLVPLEQDLDVHLRLLYEQPKGGTAGSRVNFIHPKDAGGVLVELVEPGAEAH